MARSSDIYQIKVTLTPSKPAIWRRIQVQGNTRLDQLHLILQTVTGWSNIHLHQFIIDRNPYGQPDPTYSGWGMDLNDERLAQLHQIVFRKKSKFIYKYNFSNKWKHVLLLEKILPAEHGVYYPRCIQGKRVCPPEETDSLERSGNPINLGNGFKPEAINLEAINAALELLYQKEKV